MCGICGIVSARPAVEADLGATRGMMGKLKHRGPDDANHTAGGPASLGHCRLSIIDIEGGRQPLSGEGGRYTLVYNGEIYNYRELRSRLEGLGHSFTTHSDTEVLLRAYVQYGEDCLGLLNGMFAFAVYDHRDHRLFLARDRLGIKPLHYYVSPQHLCFASELLPLVDVNSSVDPGGIDTAALDAYFAYQCIPAPATIFSNVCKLEPGCCLTYERGEAKVRRWWRLSYAPNEAITLDAAAQEFNALLDDSVRLRRISDVPLGALLSGGLDSSSVLAAMARQSDRPIRTFSIGFGDPRYDELEYAREAANHFGANHTETILEPDWLDLAQRLYFHFGEPFADSSALPTWLVSKAARESVTVALSGDGGDELFAGYTWAARTLQAARVKALPRSMRSLAAWTLAHGPQTPGLARWQRLFSDTFLSNRDIFRRRRTTLDAAARNALYQPAWRAQIAQAAEKQFDAYWDGAPADLGNAMLHHDTAFYLPEDVLTKVDRMSMAEGLEVRVPLLDYRIVEFAATLPFRLKYDRGVSKRVMKRAAQDRLPKRLLRQRKQGFAVPIHAWFRGPMRRVFEEEVIAQGHATKDILDARAIKTLWQAHQRGHADHGHALWAIYLFEVWLRYAQAGGLVA